MSHEKPTHLAQAEAAVPGAYVKILPWGDGTVDIIVRDQGVAHRLGLPIRTVQAIHRALGDSLGSLEGAERMGSVSIIAAGMSGVTLQVYGYDGKSEKACLNLEEAERLRDDLSGAIRYWVKPGPDNMWGQRVSGSFVSNIYKEAPSVPHAVDTNLLDQILKLQEEVRQLQVTNDARIPARGTRAQPRMKPDVSLEDALEFLGKLSQVNEPPEKVDLIWIEVAEAIRNRMIDQPQAEELSRPTPPPAPPEMPSRKVQSD